MYKKITLSLLAFASSVGYCFAQKGIKFVDAHSLEIIGKPEASKFPYHRIDTSKHANLPKRVAALATNGAGLAVSFKTNASTIQLKWCVTSSKGLPYLTPVAHKGFDLYTKEGNRWQFVAAIAPTSICTNAAIAKNLAGTDREYLLYLPLYDEVKSLAIGVDEKASIVAQASPFKKRVIIYGSSIVQGASASRPGLAYPAKLTRATGYQFVNLGFSGSAKMEPEVATMLTKIEGDAFVLDCVPNSTPAQIIERTSNLVKAIRKSHPKAPIIVMQSVIRAHGFYNKVVGQHVKTQNLNIQNEVLKLINEGMENIYFVTSQNFLGNDHEATIDGTHPNDMGFERLVREVQPRLMEILKANEI